MINAPSIYTIQIFKSSNKENNYMTDTLSSINPTYNSDRSFIEFTRCLYKVKSVVQEIGIFSKTVKPTLIQKDEYFYDARISTNEFVSQVDDYLKKLFDKFNHMCNVLLLVLTKLESNQPFKKERIDSFRQEVLSEWKMVIQIRQELLSLIDNRYYNHEFDNIPTSNNDDDINSMVESDDEQESDTTIEPTTSSDSSDSSDF